MVTRAEQAPHPYTKINRLPWIEHGALAKGLSTQHMPVCPSRGGDCVAKCFAQGLSMSHEPHGDASGGGTVRTPGRTPHGACRRGGSRLPVGSHPPSEDGTATILGVWFPIVRHARFLPSVGMTVGATRTPGTVAGQTCQLWVVVGVDMGLPHHPLRVAAGTVVRGFLGHRDIVRVAFAQPG